MSRRAETLADNSSQSPKKPAPQAFRCERRIAWLLLAGATIVPVLVIPSADDIFRLPKELVLRTTAIVTAALAIHCLLLRHIRLGERERRLSIPAAIAAAGFVWAGIATVFSTNRVLSLYGMVYLATLLVILLLAAHTFRRDISPFLVAAAVFLPALVNASVLIMQASGVWNPWVFDRTGRGTLNALLGNVNDVGAYLVPPIVFAFVLATSVRRLRWLYVTIGAVLSLALLVTLTLTSIVAAAAAIAALGAVIAFRTRLRSRWIAAVAAVLIVLTAAPFTYAPLQRRLTDIARAAAAGEVGEAVSGRFVPFAAAWEMFRAHPLTGVGPGCFKFNYMHYRMELDFRYPRLLAVSPPVRANFGETHNDHLQVLAENGIPGYAILLAGLAYVARISLRRKSEEQGIRQRIAETLALPLVCALAANMLAGFPLLIAAPAYTYAILGGVCIAWKDEDDPA